MRRHREIDFGLARAICKQLGIPPPAAPAEPTSPRRREARVPSKGGRARATLDDVKEAPMVVTLTGPEIAGS